eukprot:CAMPEP_0114982690 /NCGR_PEP_ID=MMETSP0216-20121206/6267_1 /TAXON_ID=223996 /ORGANISM="Protocruzia adherens, Strain Boccale" /LENGTH=194 /DNA_ID=CAMNT_0002344555 /DNA_START=152 /DNA_END=736 /DNA_ORIENTATION=-
MFFDSDDEFDHDDFEDHGTINYHGEYGDHIMRPFTMVGVSNSAYCAPTDMVGMFQDEVEDSSRHLEEQYRLTQSEYDSSRPRERQDHCSQRGDLPDILEKIGSITLKTIEHAGIIAATLLQKKIIDQNNHSRGGSSSTASVISSELNLPGYGSEITSSEVRARVGGEECKMDESDLTDEIHEFVSYDNRNYDAY